MGSASICVGCVDLSCFPMCETDEGEMNRMFWANMSNKHCVGEMFRDRMD